MRKLDELQAGETATIRRYSQPVIASRLMSMGIIPGLEIQLIRKSFSGATLLVKVRSTVLALRREEARQIELAA